MRERCWRPRGRRASPRSALTRPASSHRTGKHLRVALCDSWRLGLGVRGEAGTACDRVPAPWRSWRRARTTALGAVERLAWCPTHRSDPRSTAAAVVPPLPRRLSTALLAPQCSSNLETDTWQCLSQQHSAKSSRRRHRRRLQPRSLAAPLLPRHVLLPSQQGGIYHGRILMPAEYPFKPPAFMMLTPSGRFETGIKICLSISSHHPESWQPSWSVRSALVALIAFMQVRRHTTSAQRRASVSAAAPVRVHSTCRTLRPLYPLYPCAALAALPRPRLCPSRPPLPLTRRPPETGRWAAWTTR